MYLNFLGHNFRVRKKFIELEMHKTQMPGDILRLGCRELALATRQRRVEGVHDGQQFRQKMSTDMFSRNHRVTTDDAAVAD